MNNEQIKEFTFYNHTFAELKLEKCSITEYRPSQVDNIVSGKSNMFLIVKDGKGVVTYQENRLTLTKGMGFLVPHGNSIKLKSDSIETLNAIQIHIGGKNAAEFISNIENKANGKIINFGTHGRVLDTACDLIAECSKTFRSDYSILLSFYEFINSINELYSEKRVPSKNVYMSRAVDYIKQNYNKNISVENIANILGIERSYLSRLFKTYKNKSTQNYIIDYRIHKAKRMFEEEDVNVSQVCAAVGYTNIYCFSRIFKSRVGMPPKEYMERCRKNK